ncbi:hypothetical protein ACFLRU_01280 [Bacteroidota bacterium]
MKFTLQNAFYLLLINCCVLCTNKIFSQREFTIEKKIARIRLSGETMFMEDEANIGMIGIGYDLFGLIKKHPNVYLGVNSFSAMTGERAGIFSFGVSAGLKKRFFRTSLMYDLGVYVGGGGGGGAPDGGGLIVRPHFEFEQRVSKGLSLRAGLAKIDFPTGTISSTHFSFGVTLDERFYQVKEKINNDLKSFSEFKLNEHRISLVNTVYTSFQGDVVEDYNNTTYIPGENIELIGIQFDKFFTKNFYGSLEFNGAYGGGVDGFMSYFIGGGMTLPILSNKLFYDLRFLAGPSGGGAVATGGGASFQIETGLGIQIFKEYQLKVLAGKTFAPSGTFEAFHYDFVFGKTFELFGGISNKTKTSFNLKTEGYKLQDFSFSVFNRTYFPPNLKDKNGIKYDHSFNLIGFEVAKRLTKNLSLAGSTVWAYQGSYGAYGEGWLGVIGHQSLNKNWEINAKLMAGAGGGGGIILGSGLLFQYTAGIERKLSEGISLFANFGRFKPLEGNFNPIILDIGFKFNLSQLTFKSN